MHRRPTLELVPALELVPDWGVPGTAVRALLRGAGAVDGVRVRVRGAGVAVSVLGGEGAEVALLVRVAADAAPGARRLEVAGGAAVAFHVRVPACTAWASGIGAELI